MLCGRAIGRVMWHLSCGHFGVQNEITKPNVDMLAPTDYHQIDLCFNETSQEAGVENVGCARALSHIGVAATGLA